MNHPSWHYRATQIPAPQSILEPLVIPRRTVTFAEAKHRGLLPRLRARSKQNKDTSRGALREERNRLFQEAYHDQTNSIGEIDARTSSMILGIEAWEVLSDPKIRSPINGYQHPSLRRLFTMALDDQITLMLSRKGRYGFFPKLPRPTPQPNCPHCMTEFKVQPLVIERSPLPSPMRRGN